MMSFSSSTAQIGAYPKKTHTERLIPPRVVHDVEVHELLHLKVAHVDVLDHIGEQGAHVLARGHPRHHRLDRILALLLLFAVQVRLELKQLT